MQNIYLLVFYCLKFLPVLHGIQRRIPEQRDHRNKELRTNHIHFFILIRDIHDPIIIKFVVDFQKRHQHRIFTAFFSAVFVKLLEKIFIFMLCGSLVHLIFHLEHNRDKLCPVRCCFSENKIAFASGSGIIILLKICRRKCGHTDRIKLIHTMLLQTLTHHLRGLPGFEILVILNLLIFKSELVLILFLQGFLIQFTPGLFIGYPAFQLGDLRLFLGQFLFFFLHRARDSQFSLRLTPGNLHF